MRAEDFRRMSFQDDARAAAHRSFVRRLIDGQTRIPVLNPRRQVYDMMQMGIDAHLTTLEWSPVATMPGNSPRKQGQPTSSLNLEDVVSVVAWTYKVPPPKQVAMENDLAKKGSCWYYGVCVAYTRHRPQQLTMVCSNTAEQEQLVASFRTLARAAKQRQSALQLLERTKLAHLEPARSTSTAVPSMAIPPMLGRSTI
ncbi:hypothetical protein, variant [Aphanomyces invadans]|nr:hypothetical protein, variant [Aphanomyces invadans]ETV98860.1 hypothetical protein, variant [Aphanomyces invadans]|eukprot:XP_008872287.1 hypothetical protein, variant [Aphanomyces invadans]